MAFETTGEICENDLPLAMRIALETTRACRPDERLMCVAFYTCDNGHEVARMGVTSDVPMALAVPLSQCLTAKQLVVLSVTTTEMTLRDVRTIKHVLIARMERAGTAPNAVNPSEIGTYV